MDHIPWYFSVFI